MKKRRKAKTDAERIRAAANDLANVQRAVIKALKQLLCVDVRNLNRASAEKFVENVDMLLDCGYTYHARREIDKAIERKGTKLTKKEVASLIKRLRQLEHKPKSKWSVIAAEIESAMADARDFHKL